MTIREFLEVKQNDLMIMQGYIANAQNDMANASEVFKDEGFEEASEVLEDIWETLQQVRSMSKKFLELKVDTSIDNE